MVTATNPKRNSLQIRRFCEKLRKKLRELVKLKGYMQLESLFDKKVEVVIEEVQ